MFDLSFWQVLLRATAGIVILTVHGASIALIARLLGDSGPKHDGRLSLNPFAHVAVLGLLSIVAARVGWIKPVALDARAMRAGRAGLLVCALGALLITLAMAHGVHALRPLAVSWWPADSSPYVIGWIATFSSASVWFVLVNLLPLPPLTGGLLIAALWPAAYQRILTHVFWVGVGLAAIFVVTRGAGFLEYLRPAVRFLEP